MRRTQEEKEREGEKLRREWIETYSRLEQRSLRERLKLILKTREKTFFVKIEIEVIKSFIKKKEAKKTKAFTLDQTVAKAWIKWSTSHINSIRHQLSKKQVDIKSKRSDNLQKKEKALVLARRITERVLNGEIISHIDNRSIEEKIKRVRRKKV